MMLTLFTALAVTLPVALLGLAVGWLGERLGADAKLRAALWTTAFFATTGSALAVLLIDPLIVGFSSSMTFQAADPAILESDVETFRETYAGGAAQIVYAIEDSPRTLPIGATLLAVIALGALAGAAIYALRLSRLFRLAADSVQLGDAEVAARCRVDPAMVRLARSAAPVLAGFRRPLILLPKALGKLSREQLVMICRHELSHFRRGDNLRSVAENVMSLPLWFNPFLTLIRRRLIAVREELADADATAGARPAERRAYAETLLTALRHCGSTAAANAFTGAEARRRIQAIMRPPARAGRPVVVASCLLAAGLAAAAATSAIAAASRPQVLIAPRIIAELKAMPGLLAPSAETLTEKALAEERTRLATAEQRLAALPAASAALATVAAEIADARANIAELEAELQARTGGPIDYARLPGVRAEDLIQIVCTLTEEGKATGCTAPEPEREPDRVARAIAEISTRTWRLGEVEEDIPGGQRSRISTPDGVLEVTYVKRRTTTYPGQMSLWLQPDGKVTGGPRTSVVRISDDPEAERRQRAFMEENMRRSIARAEEGARRAVAARGQQPSVLRNEQGQVIARRVAIDPAPDWPGAPTARWEFPTPAPLRLNGRVMGELNVDAEGKLTFNGRRETNRETAIPVRDDEGVVRLRANIGALQPDDRVMLPFAPILPDKTTYLTTGQKAPAAPSFAEAAMKLTSYFKMRPQAEPPRNPVLQPASFQPDWPPGRAAPRQGPIYDAVDFLFAVDFGEDARWKTEVRVNRGDPPKPIRLPAPPDVEAGPLNYLAELTQDGQARLQMLRSDGRAIDGAVTIMRLTGLPSIGAVTEVGGRRYTVQYTATPVGEPINAATAWMPGEMLTTNAAGRVVHREPCQIPPGQAQDLTPGRCRPLPPGGRFPVGFRLQ